MRRDMTADSPLTADHRSDGAFDNETTDIRPYGYDTTGDTVAIDPNRHRPPSEANLDESVSIVRRPTSVT